MLRPVHRVRIEPDGIELDVKDGETVFKAANARQLGWPTRCGGAKSCTLCTMVVLEGVENLSKPGEEETFLVAPIARRAEVEAIRIRMACAARVRGTAVVSPRYRIGQPVDGKDAP